MGAHGWRAVAYAAVVWCAVMWWAVECGGAR